MLKPWLSKYSVLKYLLILYFLKKTTEIQVSEVYEIDVGKPVNLTCYASADITGECSVEWKKNNNRIIDVLSTSRINTDVNFSLVISKVLQEDSGNYSCLVSCNLGQRQSETILRVLNVPGQPQITGTVCNGLQSVIQWKTLSEPKVPVLSHRIQYQTNFDGDQWIDVFNFLPATIEQIEVVLKPWTNYTFRVIARNRIGESDPSLPSNWCTTPPDVPYKNPENVFGFGTDPNNLIIQWDAMPPSDQNGPDFYYKVHYRIDKPGVNWTESVNITDWTECSYEVIGQETFQRYRIKVEAFNSLGGSNTKSNEIIGFSGEDVPSQSPSNLTLLRIINATTAEIRWDPISYSSLNGNLRGFKIRTWILSDDSDNARELIIEDNVTQCFVNILWPYATNLIQVFVCNEHYDSEPSNVLTIHTPEGVPGPVQSMECESAESYTLYVSWKKPVRTNGMLTGYKLIWEKLSNISAEETECSKYIRNAAITSTSLDVTQNSSYSITIRAMTSVGVGEPFSIVCNTPMA